MGLTGRWRLGTDEEFDAEFDSQVVHPAMSDEDAEKHGEFIERRHDDGRHTGLIVIVPHGGDIEMHTDDQAQRVACCLADTAVSYWLCKGYHARGAEKPGTSLRSHRPGSFPLLNSVFSRRFAHAVAFHGFERDERDEIVVGGGTAAAELKEEIASAIEKAVAGSNILVRIAGPDDPFGGDAHQHRQPAHRRRGEWHSDRADPGGTTSAEPTSPKRSRVCIGCGFAVLVGEASSGGHDLLRDLADCVMR